ncbi:MAG TPA: hypothetical protein PK114_00225 [Smithellaceae bacterium]|nr:hypothetical protein [Smithellaceae bacterium]
MNKKSKLYQHHKKIKEAISARKKIVLWILAGRPIPPPHVVKQRIIRGYAEKYKLNTFVETGTFMGEMIDAMLPVFPKIISVEIDPVLAARAQKKFSAYPQVSIIREDSSAAVQRCPPLSPVIKNHVYFGWMLITPAAGREKAIWKHR